MGFAHHDGEVLIVDAVVVDGRFQEMGVLLEPWLLLAGPTPHIPHIPGTLLAYHFGRLTGEESILVGWSLIKIVDFDLCMRQWINRQDLE